MAARFQERDREFYRMRWHEVAEKRFADFPGIKTYRLGKVLWIGRPGYSASVEAWINKVVEELQVHTDGLSPSLESVRRASERFGGLLYKTEEPARRLDSLEHR